MRRTLSCSLLAAVTALAACGGSDVKDVDPVVLAGGGVGSGAILGELNVHVIDSATDAPLVGASVTVGALSGITDATGLVVLTGDAISGPQDVTASAVGYAVSTWFGANGANVTIPLDTTGDGPDVPTATASGSIEGWDQLNPGQGRYLVAFVAYSSTRDFGAPENQLPQPMGQVAPKNICLKAPPFINGPCEWEMNVRVGAQTHYAFIAEGDPNGTIMDQSDDTYEILGFALKTGITLADGESAEGELLERLDDSDVQDLTVGFGAAPPGLTEFTAIPMIDLGDQLMLFPFPPVNGDSPTTTVPKTTGDLSAGSYMIVGSAATAEGGLPSSTVIARGVNPGAGAIVLPAFLATATDITAAAGTYSFTPALEASLHTGSFSGADGAVWNLAFLDGRTSFTLPMLAADPLPAGTVRLKISGIELPAFDALNFQLEGIFDQLNRIAENELEFSH